MPVLSLSETDGRQYSSWSAALGGYSIAEGLGRKSLGGLNWAEPWYGCPRSCHKLATDWRPHYRNKVNRLINFRTKQWHKGARIAYILRQLYGLCYFHQTFYSYLPGLMGGLM